MRRLSTILVYLLLALWLPATQHCALEQAGLVIKTCADGCTTGQASDKDGCGTVEGGAYKPAGTGKVSIPSLMPCACFKCLHSAETLREPVELAILPAEQPQDWIAAWYFARRAAPLPGAPALYFA